MSNIRHILSATGKRIFIALFGLCWIAVSSTAQAETYEIETENFLFVGDIDINKGRQLVSDLEDYRAALLNAIGLPYLTEPVKVKIFYAAHNRQFVEMTGRQGAGGLYIRKLTGPLFVINGYDGRVGQNGLRKVAYHEFTHHLLETYYDGLLPMWYNEGLAEYFSSFTRKPDGSFVIGQPDFANMALLKQYQWMPIQTFMESVREYPFDSTQLGREGFSNVDFFYAQSWLAAHYFQSNGPARAKLQRFFDGFQPSGHNEFVFQQAFGGTYNQFQVELRNYLNNSEFKTRTIRPLRSSRSRPLKIKRLSDSERSLIVADMTQSIGAPNMDTLEIDRLYLLANAPGRQARVNIGRAGLAESLGDDATANALLHGALKLASGDPDVKTQAAVIMLRRNMGHAGINRPDIMEARKHLRRSITLNSKNITAHYYYALSYAMLKDPPSRQALMSARKAVNYFRSSEFTEQNFYLTPIFLHHGDYVQARKNIDRALVWSQSGDVKRDARRLKSIVGGR